MSDELDTDTFDDEKLKNDDEKYEDFKDYIERSLIGQVIRSDAQQQGRSLGRKAVSESVVRPMLLRAV